MACGAAALVLPPWGRAAAAVGVLTAVAAGGGGLVAYTRIHFRLGADGWTWVWVAIQLIVLFGYVTAGSALLRRRASAGIGLVGGLVVAAAWLAVGGITFTHLLNSLWSNAWLLILAPVLVGVGGTLWGGAPPPADALCGWLRCAPVWACTCTGSSPSRSSALAEIRTTTPGDAQVIDDRLGNQFAFYLLALPIVTVAIGWAAAAATARLRGAGPESPSPHPVLPAPGPRPAQIGEPRAAEPESRLTWEDLEAPDSPQPRDGTTGAIPATATRRRRTGYRLMLLSFALGSAALLALTWLRL